MATDRPWLKSMANGTLGEARVRALLLERFTVLTRSIDTDGADFLIELRDSGRFSDDLAPRLGIVQAKFAQDRATSHDIPDTYATTDGEPIDEFFVLVTVGNEDAIAYYLIAGSDLSTLPLVRRKGRDVRVLAAKDRDRFHENTISGLLDRIETSMKTRTQAQNERFLHSVSIPDFELSRGALAPMWFLPIPNEHGYIPDMVYRLRAGLRAQLYAFDGLVKPISDFIKTVDASECVSALDELLEDHSITIQTNGATIGFELRNIVSERATLQQATETHVARFNALKEVALLDDFISVAQAIKTSHVAFIEKHNEPELVRIDGTTQRLSDKLALTRIALDPLSKLPIDVSTTLVPGGTVMAPTHHFLERGRALWRFGFEGGATTWRELDRLLHELMADYFRLLFPEEVVGDTVLPAIMAK